MDRYEMVEAVRAHALKHYADGWDYVVEAWSDTDIINVVTGCRTAQGAIAKVARALGVKVEVSGYVVTTQDVDGRGQRAYKTLDKALAYFKAMAGWVPGGAAERVAAGGSVEAVSMYGTRVSLRLV